MALVSALEELVAVIGQHSDERVVEHAVRAQVVEPAGK